MATTASVSTAGAVPRPYIPARARTADPVTLCDCESGYRYEHRCCGNLVGRAGGGVRCCMDPELVARECDGCGATGYR